MYYLTALEGRSLKPISEGYSKALSGPPFLLEDPGRNPPSALCSLYRLSVFLQVESFYLQREEVEGFGFISSVLTLLSPLFLIKSFVLGLIWGSSIETLC